MTSHPDSTRVAHDALHRPIRDIAWSDDRRPHDKRERKKFRNAVAATLGISATVAGCVAMAPADAWRLADPGCAIHEVARGDTLSSIARNRNVPLDMIKQLNPQLAEPSWDYIVPGDTVAFYCPDGAEAPQRGLTPRPEWAAIKQQPYFSCEVAGKTWRYCVTDERIVVALFEAGWRGEELVMMAAVTYGEGAPAVDAVGDTDITDKVYGPSYGVVQVRSQWAMDNTGGPRDRFALWNPADPQASLDHQAWGAREVYLSQGWKAWSNWLKGGHKPHLDRMRAVAEQIGAL